ncbi:MAG TPA: aromatic-ring-hydroxylating dioxygenase subunit beta [Burkholderiales bacterium]|nr:aromatic-ring-hydroxylating dioxygenase subunit beta [Burkholderiales bacterium]
MNKVEGFLIHEARLLDERRFEEWMQLFTPEGYYWAPSRPDQQDPWTEVSLMFDDREIMQNRIARLRHPKIYAQMPHSRATRQVSNVGIDSIDEATGEMIARSVLFMFEYRPTLPEPIERLFAATCFHRLRPEGAGFKIASKKVQLTNCDAPFDPLFLYF